MKSTVLAAVLGLAALALPLTAQAQTAAGTVPNTFDNGAAPRVVTPAPVPSAPARPANQNAQSTLSTIISGARSNTLDYSLFTPDLANKIREQQAQLFPIIQGFGAVQAIDFVGSQDGADLFAVTFATAETQWVIGFEGDKVAALLFRPAE